MKKRNGLLAAACVTVAVSFAAGAAHAQSLVQLYGIAGVYVGSIKHSSGPAAAMSMGGGGLSTSFWGIRGEEDLGGGNAVVFRLESFFQPNTGALGRTPADPFLSRNAYVGVSTRYGKLLLGRQTNPTYVNMQYLNPFGVSVVFSPIVVQTFIPAFNNTTIGDSVWNNAVQYETPDIAGFTASAIYGLGGVAGANGVANLGLHARYTNGPFLAAVSLQRVRQPVTAPMTEQDMWLGGFTYNFKVAKIYALATGVQSYGQPSQTRTYMLGLSMPVGLTGSILAEWARTSRNAPLNVHTIRNTGSIAYDYALSKRTDVYLVCMYDKTSGYGSATTTAVGVRHAF
jgi:predicted porin